jgi:hypothetical protein
MRKFWLEMREKGAYIYKLLAIILEQSLKIKLIKKKRHWYDIGPLAFRYIPAFLISIIISFLAFNGYNYVFLYILLILIYLLYILLIDKKKYGWWLVNYEVIGSLLLSNEFIEIEENGVKSSYKINQLKKIQLKENYFQNYSRIRDIIHDGIGSILIDNKIDEKFVFFLLQNESDLEALHALKSKWKKLGISIWT